MNDAPTNVLKKLGVEIKQQRLREQKDYHKPFKNIELTGSASERSARALEYIAAQLGMIRNILESKDK